MSTPGPFGPHHKVMPVPLRAINKAIEAFHIATTPDSVRETVRMFKGDTIPRTEQDVIYDAVMTLIDATEKASHTLADAATESAVRARAHRMGYSVSKSRDRSLHSNNAGKFMLCDDRNTVVLGDGFDASLQDVADYLTKAV